MRFSLSFVLVSTLLKTTVASLALLQENCTSCAANPLASTYPNIPTALINSTTAVHLVPYAYARELIPSQYAILTSAYACFGIPASQYPLIIETTIDHDIRFEGINAVPDFSSFRISFPFVDRLGNGFSSFRFLHYLYLPPTNPLAIAGAVEYGEVVLPGYFDPPGAGYAITPDGSGVEFKVWGDIISEVTNSPPVGEALYKFTPNSTSIAPYPLEFYVNVTRQPQFGINTTVCDNQIRLWNTSVTIGSPAVAPRSIVGNVTVSPSLLSKKTVFTDVYGVVAAAAFIESSNLSCEAGKDVSS